MQFDLSALPATASEASLPAFRSLSNEDRDAAIVSLLAAGYRAADVVSANFTRPLDTTAYASADLVANSTTAGSVVPVALTLSRANGTPVQVRRVRLKKSGTSVTNASFRVHLYATLPTVTNGDNGVWLSTIGGYHGAFDVTIDKVFSDGAAGIAIPIAGTEIIVHPASGFRVVYALVEARAAYTPVSGEVFTVTAEVIQS